MESFKAGRGGNGCRLRRPKRTGRRFVSFLPEDAGTVQERSVVFLKKSFSIIDPFGRATAR